MECGETSIVYWQQCDSQAAICMHVQRFLDYFSIYSIEMLFPTIGSIHALSFMGTSISIDAIYIKIIQLKEKTLFQNFFLYCVTVQLLQSYVQQPYLRLECSCVIGFQIIIKKRGNVCHVKQASSVVHLKISFQKWIQVKSLMKNNTSSQLPTQGNREFPVFALSQ